MSNCHRKGAQPGRARRFGFGQTRMSRKFQGKPGLGGPEGSYPLKGQPMHKGLLAEYGLKPVADFRIEGDRFRINVTDTAAIELPGCIYAFVIKGEIVRIGSSGAPLKKRLAAWRRDVSTSLAGGKSATPSDEAKRWRLALVGDAEGIIYARQAAVITTPVGTFMAHLDEERVLIARHRPKLNRSSR